MTAIFHPSKIIAVGLNYYDHARELNMSVPEYPLIFLKPPTAVIYSGESIVYPPQSSEVHFEGELAVIIKDKIKNISVDKVHNHIAGYTCANDVTARDIQRNDGQWTRAKSFDTFCPLGPKIISDIDPSSLNICTRVNGLERQYSNTKNMIFDVFELTSYISGIMTLMPGDVIITGTPPGVGAINPGDTVEVEIEKVGVLMNKVIQQG